MRTFCLSGTHSFTFASSLCIYDNWCRTPFHYYYCRTFTRYAQRLYRLPITLDIFVTSAALLLPLPCKHSRNTTDFERPLDNMRAFLFSTVLGLLARSVAADDDDSAQLAHENNVKCQKYLGWTWAALVGTVLIYRIVILCIRHVRNIACLGHDKQRYFADSDGTFAKVKRYILLAPLFRKRHHREFRLSTAINIGTLPSRMQSLFLIGYLALNITLCTILTPWSQGLSTATGVLLGRSGVLAVMNMIPLFLLAGRNNPLISLLDVSYDTYNLIHRWLGRLVVVEGLVHALCWLVPKVQESTYRHTTECLPMLTR